jgi:negative regulator of sigma E activity
VTTEMDESGREAISALVDDDLLPTESEALVGRLLDSTQAQQLADRYQEIGAVMRASAVLNPPAAHGIAQRVAAAISQEPSVAGPPGPRVASATNSAGVVKLPGRAGRDRLPARRRWSRVSLAASLLVAGLLGFVLARQTDAPAPLAVASRAVDPPAPIAVAAPMRREWHGWDSHDPSVQQRLRGYLVNHSEYLGRGMRGMHPYARVVAYRGDLQ